MADGGYAYWGTVTDAHGRRWGATRLAANLTPATLGNVEVRIRTRTGTPCVYVRGREGNAFRDACYALARLVKAYGASLHTHDVTEPAARVLGISR